MDWYYDEDLTRKVDWPITIDKDYTLYAKWEINRYTITWKNDNGEILEVDTEVEWGSTPTYDEPTPTKEDTDEYSYVFSAWSPEITPVSGDQVYIAQFIAEAKKYTVNWIVEGTYG
jgi:hypothetical protein